MMKILVRLTPALLMALLAVPTPASAQTVEAFTAACNAHPEFFSSMAAGIESRPEDVGRLCSCLGGRFADYPEADLTMLTHDVEGTATAEERTAYGDYTALEMRALDALNGCLAAEGLTTGTQPASPNSPADMSRFDAACMSSESVLQAIGGTAEEAAPLRTTLCQCLSSALGPQISTADAAILAQDLEGIATEESRQAYPGYPQLSEIAGNAFNGCFATLHPAQ
jgi:hypothetical protein